MNVTHLLSNSGYVLVNKQLIMILGLEPAIILGELCAEYEYWKTREELDKEGYFYSTVENITKNTSLQPERQRKAMNKLIESGIIQTKRQGHNGCRHIKINETQLLQYLTADPLNPGNRLPENKGTGSLKSREPDPLNPGINNNIYNSNNKKIINNFTPSEKSINSPFDSTLKKVKEKQKESKKKVKMLVQENLCSIENIVTEKLANTNSTEVQQNRLNAIERAAKQELSAQQKLLRNNKQARIKEAQNYFTNPIVLNELNNYLDMYQQKYNIMSAVSWKNILEEIKNIKNENSLISYIKESTTRAYRKIFEVSSTSSNDNTRNHQVDKKSLRELSPQELEEFNNSLAKDENGNLLVF